MKSIRNLSFLSAMITTIALLSCKKDVEGENTTKLLGRWEGIEQTLKSCDNPDNNKELALECTDSECIRYIFAVDSTSKQVYVKQTIMEGVTISEVGHFSAGENTITFCIENDGEETCTTADLTVTTLVLVVTTKDETTGCTEVLRFQKEEEE